MTFQHKPCGLLYDTLEALARHSSHCPQTSHSQPVGVSLANTIIADKATIWYRQHVGSAGEKTDTSHFPSTGTLACGVARQRVDTTKVTHNTKACGGVVSRYPRLACPLRQWGQTQ